MVRSYEPQIPWQKWSKLERTKLHRIYLWYFGGGTPSQVAEDADTTERTVRSHFKQVHSWLSENKQLRTRILNYMSPESEPLRILFDSEDLAPGAPFWGDLYKCYFHCPAELKPNRLPEGIQRVIEEARRKYGPRVTIEASKLLIRQECHSCPLGAHCRSLSVSRFLMDSREVMRECGYRSASTVKVQALRCMFHHIIDDHARRALRGRVPRGEAEFNLFARARFSSCSVLSWMVQDRDADEIRPTD